MTESAESLALVAAALWVAIGLFLCFVMGRRGFNPFAWLVLGALLGPLAVILALVARNEKPKGAKPAKAPKEPKPAAGPKPAQEPKLAKAAKAAPPGSGPAGEGLVDVLVGYDGSAESQSAPGAAQDLLGPRMGRLTVATVVPHDCSREVERLARSELRRITGRLEGVKTRTELLHGRPAVVLGEHAAAGGFDLVVVGTRGAGASKSILGSTAKELARRTRVPVLLVGADPDKDLAIEVEVEVEAEAAKPRRRRRQTAALP